MHNWYNRAIDINNQEEVHNRFYELWNKHKGLTTRHYTTNANDLEQFEEMESEAYIAYHTLFSHLECIEEEYPTEAKAKSKWVNEIFKQVRKYNRFNRDVSNKVKSDRTLKYEQIMVDDFKANMLYTPEDEIIARID